MQSQLMGQIGRSPATMPATVNSGMAMSPPSTPGTAASLSTAYSVGSRRKRLGRKLSFWKKREVSVADVRSSMQALQKSHLKYTAATQRAVETLREWSSHLDAPSKYPTEWQAKLANPELQALLLVVCQAMHPVYMDNALLTQIFGDFTSGLRSLTFYEENCKHVADEVAAAERRYYKERRRCTQMIEAKAKSGDGADAETVAAGELAVYENACLGLRSQMADAGAQYRRQCQAELPRQFEPVCSYMRQREYRIRQAIISIQNAQMGFQVECLGNYLTPDYNGMYTPSSLRPATAPLRLPTDTVSQHAAGHKLHTLSQEQLGQEDSRLAPSGMCETPLSAIQTESVSEQGFLYARGPGDKWQPQD